MSEVLNKIKTRRSIRKYKNTNVEQEKIDKIIEAGLYAASAKGMQNAIIIQVEDKKLIEDLKKINAEIAGYPEGKDPFFGAPVVLIVLSKKSMDQRVYDGSLVMGNLMLAAHELGLGSCWVHRAKQEFEMDFGKNILKSLGIDEEYEGIGHCVIGYPDCELPDAPARKENRVYKI